MLCMKLKNYFIKKFNINLDIIVKLIQMYFEQLYLIKNIFNLC